ncbi:MAG: hypothetical protein KME20_18940 [Kaiparowitsia implicata GSE-PSE-MK54-09C]|jgi:hypothetical protein|nr:hypothetical protein [Kaiparowitsia implicata GSE-PSE-MK54-09C]
MPPASPVWEAAELRGIDPIFVEEKAIALWMTFADGAPDAAGAIALCPRAVPDDSEGETRRAVYADGFETGGGGAVQPVGAGAQAQGHRAAAAPSPNLQNFHPAQPGDSSEAIC